MSAPVLAVNARDPEELRVALAAGGRLIELRAAHAERETLVGNLYLGVVRQVEPGLDAAFVDFGTHRAGFLYAGNVHPGYGVPGADPGQVAAAPAVGAEAAAEEVPAAPDRSGRARVEALLRPGQRVLVQVLRDAARGKGATLTTYPALAGRWLVLMPSLGRPGVSRRIEDEGERQRLRAMLAEVAPPGLGVIARTAAVGAGAEELRRDLEHLQRRWRAAQEAAGDGAPRLLQAEASAAVRAARDLYMPEIARVVADQEAVVRELEAFFAEYLPEPPPVERYRQARPLFEALDLERDYQILFRSRVPIPGGGSIVFHESEALIAIDVNSGRIDAGSLEQTARATNLSAADEIGRQVRLRDLGGIVVIDFIDLHQPEHRRELEAAVAAAFARDRARVKFGRLGAFGLLALTRRRQGTGLVRATETPCRLCGGSGSLAASQAGALRVLRRLRAGGTASRVRVHPSVAACLHEAHAAALAALAVPWSLEEDSQVPAGEPAFDA